MKKSSSSPVALTWQHEKCALEEGHLSVGGLDEAGRGCLAGPVVAACYVFAECGKIPHGLNDSKKLSRKKRAELFGVLREWEGARFGVGLATPEEIDEINILQASHLAMKRAVQDLDVSPSYYLVDGLPIRDLGLEHEGVVKGDGKCPSIAAASILAKETRDRMMEDFDEQFPGYGFSKHKGYGTKAHLEALERMGPCGMHRQSFAPVRQTTFSFGSND